MSAIKNDDAFKIYSDRKVAGGTNKMNFLNAVRNKIINRVFAVARYGSKIIVNNTIPKAPYPRPVYVYKITFEFLWKSVCCFSDDFKNFLQLYQPFCCLLIINKTLTTCWWLAYCHSLIIFLLIIPLGVDKSIR